MESERALPPERVVRFRARTVLILLGIILSVALTLQVVWLARQVLTWILISVFLALALNPGSPRRSPTSSPCRASS